MRAQSTQKIAMVRPAAFQFNRETATSNSFQHRLKIDSAELLRLVHKEFDQMVEILGGEGVAVTVLHDKLEPKKPDAIFPNNWVSFHQSGEMVLYPMLAPNRRLERNDRFLRELNFKRKNVQTIDLSNYESQNQILEGTGSLILDRVNKWAFAALSPRTDAAVFDVFKEKLAYEGLCFECADGQGAPIYHTNVMMAIGNSFAVLAEDCIPNPREREELKSCLSDLGKALIRISQEQVNQFCGNIIELQDQNGQGFIVLSETAQKAFTDAQLEQLSSYARLRPIAIPTIEAIGGGSVRCMILELF